MISNQVIYNCIREANEISKVEFAVSDIKGNEIARTENCALTDKRVILGFAQSDADIQEVDGSLLFRICDENQVNYVLTARGGGDTFLVGKLIVSQLQSLITAYKEKVDRNSFYQNLLLDNLLPVDIYNRAKKLRIDEVKPRCVFVIETDGVFEPVVSETVKELFNTQKGDFVTSVNERHIIVIKVLKEGEGYEQLDETASMLVDMLNAEAMANVRVAFGSIAEDIKSLPKSYKEAGVALDVGKIFYAQKKIISYITLGIGRLIYQLPVNLCKMFVSEIFGDSIPEEVDEEILQTVNKFFDNSLNVSETSRQLFIHRNTLVYRIEKLQKATGLDVRIFDDALTFKLALMVVNYVNYMEKA